MSEESLGTELLRAARQVDHLPPDLMLVKMEGEHIMTMAAARKVHLPTLIKEARELLEANPMAAHAAVYSKPVGMKPDVCKKCGHKVQRKSWQTPNLHCPKCGGQGNNKLMIPGKQQYARGLSIKAATSLANLVGYNRVASSFAPVDDGVYRVTSIFTDYSRGIIRSKERLVSQWRRAYGTNKLEKQDDERFLEMTLLGAQSKNERNTIIAGLPYELTQAYEQAALEVAPKFLDAAKINEMLEAFATKGITLVDLQVLVGRSKTEGWRKEEYETMRGVWSALENGEMTVDELQHEVRPGPNDDPDADDSNLTGTDAGPTQEQPPATEQQPTQQRQTRRRQTAAPAGETAPATPAEHAANVASELTGGTGGTKSTPAATTQPAKTQERPAWLGLADIAGEAASAGRYDFAARKLREAAGCHPSNNPDDPKVVSLLKQAKDCEAKADEVAAKAGAAVPPESHQTTTTKRAPAPEQAAAPSPEPQPTAPAAGPPGAPTATMPPTGGRKQWTPATCRSYLNTQWGEEMGNYDVDRLCEVAANQGAPQIYLDNMMNRTNPNWQNFMAKPKATQGPVGGDDAAAPLEGELPPDMTDDQFAEFDKKDPVLRPPMISTDAQQYEKMITGYKQPKRIDTLIENDVEPSESLTNDEVAYLKYVGRQKKRELAAASKGGNGGQLPGMG